MVLNKCELTNDNNGCAGRRLMGLPSSANVSPSRIWSELAFDDDLVGLFEINAATSGWSFAERAAMALSIDEGPVDGQQLERPWPLPLERAGEQHLLQCGDRQRELAGQLLFLPDRQWNCGGVARKEVAFISRKTFIRKAIAVIT